MIDRRIQYRKMHVLLKELGIAESKPFLLEGYGVEHTNDLSDQDLVHLVDRLMDMWNERMNDFDQNKKKWRSNILSILNKYGVYVTNSDWTAVNRLLLDPRICGKLLYEMSIPEMQEVCVRLHIILKKKMDKMEENDRLAKLN
jgi:hypothetical protein